MIRRFVGGLSGLFWLSLLCFGSAAGVHAQYETPTTIPVPSPYELIQRVNSMRNANGYAALVIDPILMGSAQAVAEGMAYHQYVDHAGNTREKLMAAGYGAGDVAWGTENIAGGPNLDLDTVLNQVWADNLHRIPVVNANYQHIGAAIIEVNGEIFYVLHAGYTSNGKYQPQTWATLDPDATPDPNATPTAAAVSQLVVGVVTAQPDAAGRVVHVVRSGQTLWSIADAYGTSVANLAAINGLTGEQPTIYIGQRLVVRVVDLALTSTSAPQPTRLVTATPLPAPTLTGLPVKTTTPTVMNMTPQERESRQRWWLYGILAVLGASLLIVTLIDFGPNG